MLVFVDVAVVVVVVDVVVVVVVVVVVGGGGGVVGVAGVQAVACKPCLATTTAICIVRV